MDASQEKEIIHRYHVSEGGAVFVLLQAEGGDEGAVDGGLLGEIFTKPLGPAKQRAVISAIYDKIIAHEFDFAHIYNIIVAENQQIDLKAVFVATLF